MHLWQHLAWAAVAFALGIGKAIPTQAQQSRLSLPAPMPAFFVREVTSRHPHRAVCLVCRYGERPVVVVVVRRLSPRVRKWICQVDQLVHKHRAQGVRGFAMFLGKDMPYWQPRLIHLARHHKVRMPLTLPVQRNGPDQLALNPRVPVTVIFYQHRKILAQWELQQEQLGPGSLNQIRCRLRGQLGLPTEVAPVAQSPANPSPNSLPSPGC